MAQREHLYLKINKTDSQFSNVLFDSPKIILIKDGIHLLRNKKAISKVRVAEVEATIEYTTSTTRGNIF